MERPDKKALREGVGEVLRLTSLPEEELQAEMARLVNKEGWDDEDELDIFNMSGLW